MRSTNAIPPSAHGYATSPPLHREVRAAFLNRDSRETARNEGGLIGPPRNPLKSTSDSAGFLHPSDRFVTDGARQVAGAEAERRRREQAKVQTIKQQRTEREQQRWTAMENLLKKQQEDAARIAGTGVKNRGSVGYNLVNGSWGSNDAAAKAKYHDDSVEYRAKMRTENLDRRSNTNFNVITGEPRPTVYVPPVPVRQPL
jgi:hypothetical protein